MAAPPPGVAFLSMIARLEHPCQGNIALFPAVTFDALLPCQNDHAISPILCNACYIRCSEEIISQGNYQLFLQVTILITRSATATNLPSLLIDCRLLTECSSAKPCPQWRWIHVPHGNSYCESFFWCYTHHSLHLLSCIILNCHSTSMFWKPILLLLW